MKGIHYDCKLNALPNDFHVESNVLQWLGVQNQTPIKNKCWLVHGVVNLGIVEGLEFIPFSDNHDGIGFFSGFICRFLDRYMLVNYKK
jgi:hypothetical protein